MGEPLIKIPKPASTPLAIQGYATFWAGAYVDTDSTIKFNPDGKIRQIVHNSAHASFTGQTAPITVVTWTAEATGNAHTYMVSANVLCTAYTSGNINAQVAYTDEGGTSRTGINLQGHFTSGYGVNISGTGPFECQPILIRVQPGTTITISTAGTFVATYNVAGCITRMH